MTKETTTTALVTLQPENALTLFTAGTGLESLLTDIRKQASKIGRASCRERVLRLV